MYVAGASPDPTTAVLVCRMAALISFSHFLAQLLDLPKVLNLLEKTGAVLVGYMAVVVFLKVKQFFKELDQIEEMTGLDL